MIMVLAKNVYHIYTERFKPVKRDATMCKIGASQRQPSCLLSPKAWRDDDFFVTILSFWGSFSFEAKERDGWTV